MQLMVGCGWMRCVWRQGLCSLCCVCSLLLLRVPCVQHACLFLQMQMADGRVHCCTLIPALQQQKQ